MSANEATQRLRQHGPNKLEDKKPPSALALFLGQFRSLLVIILIAATLISALIGEFIDAAIILVIVMVNAVLGFLQEQKAERALEALKKLAAPNAEVLRNGKALRVPAHDLVPGDIVLLKVGDKVPADCRVVEEMNLKADEAILTGESLPVRKTADVMGDVPLAERKNMLFAGTAVVYGRCSAAVVSTGMQTEFGKIAQLLETGEEATPLQKNLAVLGRQLGLMVIGIAGIIFVAGYLLGEKIVSMLLTSVALAVAAIPEGLPAVVTITLAIGLHAMARKQAIIRKLPAVETLGATDVICSDKTGTLTMNEMTVTRLYVNSRIVSVTGEGYSTEGRFLIGKKAVTADDDIRLLLTAGALCNDADREARLGDPTELALLVSAQKAGIADLRKTGKRLEEIPFDSNRKMMTVVYDKTAYTKGAVEEVLKKSSHIHKAGAAPMTEQDRNKIHAVNRKFASSGLRVLACAYKPLGREKLGEDGLVFIGLQAMRDTPRKEVKDAVERCRSAGIRVVMITGDHKDTAVAVAKELHILEKTDGVLTGNELDSLDDDAFLEQVDRVAVYARVSPEHKVRITEALKKRGHVVAMTGDGVNDAPALKKADIGIAMGATGTDVTKEASDMVLVDDNFSSIVAAVEEGRTIYDNIKKFVYYLLSANIGEVLIIFLTLVAALVMGSPLLLPLLPIHLLWINLLTDGFPALALGVEPAEPDVMKRRPRNPDERILNRHSLSFIMFRAFIIAGGTLVLFYAYLPAGTEKARTVAFTVLVCFELFAALSMRSLHPIASVGFFSNRKLVAAVASSIALQLLVLYTPLSTLFETIPLPAEDLAIIVVAASTAFLALEARKMWRRVN